MHLVFSGARNPYTWNDDAIAAAVGRRRLLARLVEFWFAGRVRRPGQVRRPDGHGHGTRNTEVEKRAAVSPIPTDARNVVTPWTASRDRLRALMVSRPPSHSGNATS